MGCNCGNEKSIKLKDKLNKIMKKNVTYKLKKAYLNSGYLVFNKDKYVVENMSQDVMKVLYKNNTDFAEIVESPMVDSKPTNTYDKKKTNKKK